MTSNDQALARRTANRTAQPEPKLEEKMATELTNEANHQNRASEQSGVDQQRVDRWLRRWNPVLMAWVSGLHAAFGFVFALSGDFWLLNAMVAIGFAAIAVSLQRQAT